MSYPHSLVYVSLDPILKPIDFELEIWNEVRKGKNNESRLRFVLKFDWRRATFYSVCHYYDSIKKIWNSEKN